MTTLNIPSEQKEKKAFLVELSKHAKKAVASGKFKTINEALIEFYMSKTGAKKLASYQRWMNHGYLVKKGSKGFPIWSRPIKTNRYGETRKEPFYSVCSLFSEHQVVKARSQEHREETPAGPETKSPAKAFTYFD